MDHLKRREFLKASAAIAAASAAGGFSCIEIASAASISPPVVDRLSVRVLIDGGADPSLRDDKRGGITPLVAVLTGPELPSLIE